MKKISFVILAVLIFTFANILNTFAAPRNVLIEYVTGTWCGNCPCGHQTLGTINSQYPQTIVIAYHAFSNDPWRNFNGNEIVSLMGFAGTPTADIDRKAFLGNSNYPLWISTAQDRYTTSAESKVNILISNKSYNEATRQLNFVINSTALENLSGQYKINIVVTESNLIYQQNFYSQCGTPGIVPNYNHNHVARNMVNGARGENLNSGNIWNSNQTFINNISTQIDPQWNAENCKVVIFVYKENSTLNLSEIQQALETSVTGTVGISGNSGNLINEYSLSQNYPNPFNPSTIISYSIPNDVKSETSNVKLIVYNVIGKEVKVLVNEQKNAGSYNVKFDGSNLSSGIYIYKLSTGNFSETKRMMLIK